MEWHFGKPDYIKAEFEVWLKDGQIRKCKRVATGDYTNLFYTDSNQPVLNSHCAMDDIMKWRIARML